MIARMKWDLDIIKIMREKEKAIELLNLYKKHYDDEKAKQKVHAMIDRSINDYNYKGILDTTDNPIAVKDIIDDIVFYKQVKIELDKL